LIALLAYGRRVSAAVPCIVAAGAIVFAVPSLWFLAQRGPLSGADVSPPYRSWEVSQSASIGDTLAQLGYSARYPETFLRTLGPWSVVVVEWAVWAIAALALTGCIAARSRKALVLAALGVAGVVWVCGVRGPAAPVWEWLFANSALAAFLREFFHAAVLVAVAYAALAALGLRWIARRSAIAATALGFVLVACSGMATWSGGLGPSLPHVSAPPYAPELAARLPETDHRVMFLPPERPLFVRADRIGGIDAFDWAGAHQRSTFEYYPSGPLAFAASALARGDWAPALHVLPRAACDAVVWRPDVTSPLWPADGPPRSDAASGMPLAGGARLYEIRAADMVSGARAAAPMPPSLRDFSADASLVYLDDPGRDAAASLERGIDSPDPSSGWVGYRDSYWAFGDGLATPTLGIVTSRRAAAIGVPTRGDDLLLWAPRGALVNGMKVVAAQYERIRAAGSVATIQALGPTAVGEIGERPASAAVEPSGASGRATSPWSYGGSIDVKGPGLLVLRQRYDPGWTVSVEGMRVDGHYRADGMTNAWVIDGDGVASFRIVYAPQRTAFWLLGLSLFLAAAWVAIAVSYRAAATASAVVPNGK